MLFSSTNHTGRPVYLQAEGKRLAVPLGPLDFALGCGSGLGMLNLECSFTPSSSSRESKVGALVVRIFSVRRLPKMDLIGWCNPYVAVSLSGGSRASRGQGRGRGKRRTDTTVTRTVRDFNSVAHYW